MTRSIALSLLCLALGCADSSGSRQDGGTELGASECADEPVGLAALTQIERLPFLRPSVHARAFTSADRVSATGNMDYDQYLTSRDGENTLFDARGPGLITRFWRARMDAPGGEVRFYFDDEPTPSLVVATDRLWSGATPPFTPPLTLDFRSSSGGEVTYLPIAFSKSLRITDTKPPDKDYYQIDYYELPERQVETGVTTGSIVQEASDVMKRVGSNPLRATRDARKHDETEEGTLKTIAAGALQSLLELEGPRQIVELVLELDGSASSLAAFAQARLIVSWDGATEPAVDAPLSMFFAHGAGVGPRLRTLLVGNAPEGGLDTQFYAYFPMPFARSASLAIRAGELPLSSLRYRVVHRPFEEDIARAGYFHARHQLLPPVREAEVISLSGAAGNYVGLVFVPNADADLEGDGNIYVDGMATPVRLGTGTEDYFNGGWYYDHGSFSTPLHGASLAGDAPDGSRRLSQYRFHPNDPIPFTTDFRMTWEMGVGAQAVVYYYAQSTPLRVESDVLDVGEPASEAPHQYASTGVEVELTASLLGQSLHDRGRAVPRGASSSFVIDVDPENAGVSLRRRYDVQAGLQRARVSVNGQDAGVWLSPQLGAADARWVEDEYYLPRALTAAASLTITLTVESDVWSEYAYRALSQRPTNADCLSTPSP